MIYKSFVNTNLTTHIYICTMSNKKTTGKLLKTILLSALLFLFLKIK